MSDTSSLSTLSTLNTTGITLSGSGYTSPFTVATSGTIQTHAWWGIEAPDAATIVNAGSINAYLYGVELDGGGAITNAAGGVINGGLFNGINTQNDPITVDNAGTIHGGGVGIELRGGGNTIINSGVISGGRAIYFGGSNASDTLIIRPGAQFTGGIYIEHATETLNIIGEGFAAGDTIGLSILSTPTSTYIPGQSYSYPGGPNYTSPGYTQTSPGTAVMSITNSAGQVVETLALGYNDPDNNALTATLQDPACFLDGTLIRTTVGDVAVEALTAMHFVLTPQGPVPVRWVGRSEVSSRFGNARRSLPIGISAGALGEGVPARNLFVSPDHALLLGGVLVQTGALINGTTIRQKTDLPARFTYYHVELPLHAVLYAEGALAESFVDNVDRMNFHNWDARTAPAEPIREMELPRAKSARQVPSAVRRILAERETELGYAEALTA